MAESMPGGLNMGNMDTLSSRSSSLDKRKNLDLNSMDSHSDEHGTCVCVCVCVCACARACACALMCHYAYMCVLLHICAYVNIPS